MRNRLPVFLRLPGFLAIISILLGYAPWSSRAGAPVTVEVAVDRPGAKISPVMWGIFFEDINFGADGGLYAELIKNRSFEFPEPLMGWNSIPGSASSGSFGVRSEAGLSSKNAHYLRLKTGIGNAVGVSNEGFRGIGLKEGEIYDFSARIRQGEHLPTRVLRVELIGVSGETLATGKLKGFARDWREYTLKLRSRGTDPKARLQLVLEGGGALDLDLVSLFPRKTWKGRPRGLRADMVQMLADLKPGFLRFPGGCIVEGRYLTNRYDWKSTIGPVENRQLMINRWNNEFAHRPAPDYFQSFGLGFFEYFQLCEDIGAEPLPILNCGMACQFNSGELVPLDQLDPFIQDALDLIEFANGSPQTVWGAKRAAMGHPGSFQMKLLGVGNEQWGPQYIERYARFAKALKAKHPEVRLVSSAGPAPADERFHAAWKALRTLPTDIVDEHCYADPKWFFDNVHRYDGYDRKGPKIFMGEYAAQSVGIAKPSNRNNLECALAEAAYMTGLERNADVVEMSSYAPLFGHLDAWQWTPNLIWCDNLRVFGTPNYYAQQLFSRNRGDVVLPVQLTGDQAGSALFASAVKDDKSGEVILKVINRATTPAVVKVRLSGAPGVGKWGLAKVLAGNNPGDENTIDAPRKVAPITSRFKVSGPEFEHQFAPYSATVLRLKVR